MKKQAYKWFPDKSMFQPISFIPPKLLTHTYSILLSMLVYIETCISGNKGYFLEHQALSRL